MEMTNIASGILGVVIGACVSIVFFKNIVVAGTMQIDKTKKPFFFRLSLSEDIDDIVKRPFVIFKVDSSWAVNRDKYIHQITEEELESHN